MTNFSEIKQPEESSTTSASADAQNSAKRFLTNTRFWFQYQVYFFVLRTKGFFRRLYYSTSANLIRAIIILVVAVGASFGLDRAGVASTIELQDLKNFLITAGSMIGGILAIVFSLLLFAIQNAANQYSSSYYPIYLHKERGGRTFIAIVLITLSFFATALYLGKFQDQASLNINLTRLIVYVLLFLVGLVFVLVDYYYQSIKRVLNPINALRGAVITASRLLGGMKKDAILMSKIILAQNKGTVSGDYALAASYFHFTKPHTAQVDSILENLFGVAGKLVERHEVSAANRYLWAIGSLLTAYLHIRKDSSLRLPSGESIFAQISDSQRFIGNNLERFNTWAAVFMRAGKIENAVTINNILVHLTKVSRDIIFVGSRTNDNPILEQINGYRRFLAKEAIKLQAGDVVLNAADSMKELAPLLVEKNHDATLYGLLDELFEIAIFGITSKATYITERCNDALLNTIEAVFKFNHWQPQHIFDKALEKLKHTTETLHFYVRSLDYQSRFASYSTLLKPYQVLPTILQKYTHKFLDSINTSQNDEFVSTLLNFSEELYRMLRDLSEELKDASADFYDAAGELIYYENIFLQEVGKKQKTSLQNASEVSEIDRRIKFNIFLPYWFLANSKSLSADLHYTEFTDPIGKFALVATEDSRWDFVEDCVRAFWDIAHLTLERVKDGYAFTEPRIMEELCYLGILAQKNGQHKVLDQVKHHIKEFEQQYKKKYFSRSPKEPATTSPTEDQLQTELILFSRDLIRHGYVTALRDSFKDEVEQKITYKDVDQFLTEVWGIRPSHAEPQPKAISR